MLRAIPGIVMVALTACAALPSPTAIGPNDAPGPSVPELAAGEVSEGPLTMRVSVEPAVVAAGQSIEVETILEVAGSEPLLLTGSGSGIVGFSVTRLGDGLTSGPPGFRGDCRRHELPAGEPTVVAFAKSGGWSPDDPNAAFLEAYFAQPELTLPPGNWQIDVAVHATLGGDCAGPPIDLQLSLPVTVTE